MRLSDVVALVPGTRIALNATPDALVQLRCGSVPLFQAKVGRRKNRLAVRIERSIERVAALER